MLKPSNKPDKNALLCKFKEFLYGITDQDKLALLYHRDPDGICSSIILEHTLEKLGKKRPMHVLSQEYHDLASTVERLRKDHITKVILVDIGIDSNFKIVSQMEEFAQSILIVDHHKLYCDLNSSKTLFIKAQWFSELDGSMYPASKLTYDLCAPLANLTEHKAIACIGILGDMGYDHWKPFFEQTQKETGLTLGDLKLLMEHVNAVETIVPKQFNEFQKYLYHLINVKEILTSDYATYHKTMLTELTRLESDFIQNAEWHKDLDLVFYTLESEHNMKSGICNRLTLQYPTMTVIVFEPFGKRMRFSGRRQDFKVKINELISASIEGIPDSAGGGHIPAAAGGIPVQYTGQFKENVRKYLFSHYKK